MTNVQFDTPTIRLLMQCASFVPVLGLVVAGLFMESPPGRKHRRWPQIRTLQNIEVFLIGHDFGPWPPISIGFGNGLAHALPFTMLPSLGFDQQMATFGGLAVLVLFTAHGCWRAFKWLQQSKGDR